MHNLTEVQMAWLVGLLDGEGWFRLNGKSPCVGLAMTDRDTIQRVATMFGCNITIRNRCDDRQKYLGNKWKPCYGLTINGEKARDLMVALLNTGLLSERRTNKIKEVLAEYNARPVKRLAKSQVMELRNDFIGGMNSKELSKKYGITPECINRHIRDIREEQEQALVDGVIAGLRAGLTRKELAVKYNKNYETINRILRRSGLHDLDKLRIWAIRKATAAANAKRRRFTPEDVINIRNRYKNGETFVVLARDYGVVAATIFDIVHRKSYRDVPQALGVN